MLLLDEPTNDLDIATLTVLENFLGSFPGAVLTVSHDRYFQDKVSNELLAFENGEINHYFGAYSDYLAVKMEEKIADKAVSKTESPVIADKRENTDKAKLTYMEKKEWETIESQIAEIEERISEIDTEMNENGSNTELLLDLQKELDNKTKELEEKYERWEYLSERAD